MGVRVSPDARSTVPKMIVALRNSMGIYRMKKYSAASERRCGSAFIHSGIFAASKRGSIVNRTPESSTASTACADARRASSCCPRAHGAGDVGEKADTQRGHRAVDQPVYRHRHAHGCRRVGADVADHGRVDIGNRRGENLFHYRRPRKAENIPAPPAASSMSVPSKSPSFTAMPSLYHTTAPCG